MRSHGSFNLLSLFEWVRMIISKGVRVGVGIGDGIKFRQMAKEIGLG